MTSSMLKFSIRNSPTISSSLKMRCLSTKEVISKESRRALRKEKSLASSSSVSRQSIPMSKGWIPFYGCVVGIGAFAWAITAENDLGKSLRNSDAWRWVTAQYGEISRPFSEPNATKLLPDWPYIPNTPPGLECPPTLVLDLEGTLCTSVWDHKFGWRHVKRPGVEKFLRDMGRVYEVVIFTSNIAGTAEPIIFALDKEGAVAHRLYREATKFMDGAHVKDLSALNRDLRKVIIVDDDPKAFQLQPSNAIRVPTFKDAMDKNDTTLEDLTPFLLALVHEEVPDVRNIISSFPSNDSAVVSDVYNSKLNSVKERREHAMNRGLGGILRSIPANPSQAPSDAFVVEKPVGSKVSRMVKASDEVKTSNGPLTSDRKGGLWKRIDSLKSEAEEVNKKKMEAFQEVMMKRERERVESESE